ncbi:MAG: kynureninase [Burkholderiales bacterium PBB5]|nr:MAG: kynureninase [Burkholderiales bacterium PBB5]
MTDLTRDDCLALDRGDALAPLRQLFTLPPGMLYLDGNSLGAMPTATAGRLQQVVQQQWGQQLIASWNPAGRLHWPQQVGDKIAQLVGAAPGEVVAADTTSINLYKVLHVALQLQHADAPQRRVIVSERENFPTDLYIAQSLAQQFGCTLKLVDAHEIPAQLNADLAVLLLTQVNYRSGALHDMAALNTAAHAAGALVVWDLAHSAGALPVQLNGSGTADGADAADFAIGCGYKYLNGGPGAPAFAWLHARHARRMDAQQLWQPLSGWLGHAAPFAFTPDYKPAAGVNRFVCGTPSILGLAALDCGVDTLLAAQPLGGLAALRAKSLALGDLFIRLVQQRCAGHGLELATPQAHAQRGSQVSLRRVPDDDGGAYAIVQALIARGMVGDYREPAILRFGFTPLYLGFADVWDAVDRLHAVLASGEWREPRFHQRGTVT